MKKKKTKKTVIFIIILLIIAAALFLWLRQKSKTPSLPEVKTGAVVRKDIEQTVDLKGTVTGSDSADVYSKSANRISEILVKEGDRVELGDVLARLEDDSSDILRTKAQLTYDSCKRDYENKLALYEVGAVPREEYLQAESAFRQAELSLEEIDREADPVVKSPIKGTVTRVNASVGKLAGGNLAEALFVIENIDELRLKLRVSEYDINKVKPGQTVRIGAEVLGKKKVHGSVLSIAPTGELKNVQSSEMVIPVTVAVDREDSDLFAGVTAKAEIITGSVENALSVPLDAVMEDIENDEQYVFVVRDGVLSKVVIDVLLEGDFDTAVSDGCGIVEGDMIVLSPDYSLKDGTAVTEKP